MRRRRGARRVRNLRAGRLGPDDAIVPWLRTVARNKFADRLRAYLRWRDGRSPPWELIIEREEQLAAAPSLETRSEVAAALERLDGKQHAAVVEVYLEGRTYAEAAQVTGIPLGSLKRHLREGLAQLRRDLVETFEKSDPIPARAEILNEEGVGSASRQPVRGERCGS